MEKSTNPVSAATSGKDQTREIDFLDQSLIGDHRVTRIVEGIGIISPEQLSGVEENGVRRAIAALDAGDAVEDETEHNHGQEGL